MSDFVLPAANNSGPKNTMCFKQPWFILTTSEAVDLDTACATNNRYGRALLPFWKIISLFILLPQCMIIRFVVFLWHWRPSEDTCDSFLVFWEVLIEGLWEKNLPVWCNKKKRGSWVWCKQHWKCGQVASFFHEMTTLPPHVACLIGNPLFFHLRSLQKHTCRERGRWANLLPVCLL